MHSYEMVGCNEHLARVAEEGKEWERSEAEEAYNQYANSHLIVPDAVRDLPYVAEWSRSTPQPHGKEKHCIVQLKNGLTVEIELFARTGIRMICGYVDGNWDVFPESWITKDETSCVVF